MFFDRKDEFKSSIKKSKNPLPGLLDLFQNISKSNSTQILPTALISIMDDYLLTPAEYVKKHIEADPAMIAQYCLDLFRENQQNGVSCALNALSVEQRASLLNAWQETQPLLQAYYSSKVNPDPKLKNEWDNVDVISVKKQYINQHLEECNTSEKNASKVPVHLLHALKIKLKFEELKLNSLMSGGQIFGVREKIVKIKMELEALIMKSSLHLNFRGETIPNLELRHSNLSTLDFTDALLSESLFTFANLKYAEFNNSRLYSVNMYNACLDGAKFISTEIFNCFINVSQMRETIFCNVTFKSLNPKGHVIGANFLYAVIDQSSSLDIQSWVRMILDNPPKNRPWLTLFKVQNEPSYKDAIAMLWLMGFVTKQGLQTAIVEMETEQIDALTPSFKQALQNYCNEIVIKKDDASTSPQTKALRVV